MFKTGSLYKHSTVGINSKRKECFLPLTQTLINLSFLTFWSQVKDTTWFCAKCSVEEYSDINGNVLGLEGTIEIMDSVVLQTWAL